MTHNLFYLLIVKLSSPVFRQGMIALLFIHSFGLKALPTERGKVKPVDCPKKQWQEEAHAFRRE
jgi:hypothetical protein